MNEHILSLTTADNASISSIAEQISLPQEKSHKGENGRLLVIGGSHSFHAASLWSAEVASHMVDIVHYASTKENNEILLSLRKKFRNGIVVPQHTIPSYIEEDDAILIGPGMERGTISDQEADQAIHSYDEILTLPEEHLYTYHSIQYILSHYPNKRYVFDAAGLQMLRPHWFLPLKQKPIITPHQKEFKTVFGISVESLSLDEKRAVAKKIATQYHCVIVLKAITDIITDGTHVYTVTGGNQGLTKGGTGDVLAGLISSLYTKNDPLVAAVFSSFVLKKTSDRLYETHGYWYNVEEIIHNIPYTLKILLLK